MPDQKIFYIADTHFNHTGILSFDNRPFFTVEDMDEAIISRWNDAVSIYDKVYILGDLSWHGMEKTIEILWRLHGKKILIRGNHDKCNDRKFLSMFETVKDYMEIKDGDRDVILCHYPIPFFKNHYYGWYHLYGHVHSSFEYNMANRIKFEMEQLYSHPCKMYNVGVMMPYMNYSPRTLDEIITAN